MRTYQGSSRYNWINRPLSFMGAAFDAYRLVVLWLRWAVATFFLAFFGLVAQGTTLVGRRVFYLAVDGAAFVIFG